MESQAVHDCLAEGKFVSDGSHPVSRDTLHREAGAGEDRLCMANFLRECLGRDKQGFRLVRELEERSAYEALYEIHKTLFGGFRRVAGNAL